MHCLNVQTSLNVQSNIQTDLNVWNRTFRSFFLWHWAYEPDARHWRKNYWEGYPNKTISDDSKQFWKLSRHRGRTWPVPVCMDVVWAGTWIWREGACGWDCVPLMRIWRGGGGIGGITVSLLGDSSLMVRFKLAYLIVGYVQGSQERTAVASWSFQGLDHYNWFSWFKHISVMEWPNLLYKHQV